ncbi:MAG TPA: hypothetical protein VGQ82_07880, partial [Chthoniobacterales bacterium]|nr:hypothetical protein [Chthoniobacterales bacterium]
AAPYTRAADYGGARHFYRERYTRLRYEMDHLDRMLGHVRGELRAYRAGRQLWSQYGQARAEFAHLNSEFRRGTGSWRHIHGEIERLHARLHDLETRLRVRASDRYRW